MREDARSLLDRYIKKYTDAKEAYSNAYEQYLEVLGKDGVDEERKALLAEAYRDTKLKKEVLAELLADFAVNYADEF